MRENIYLVENGGYRGLSGAQKESVLKIYLWSYLVCPCTKRLPIVCAGDRLQVLKVATDILKSSRGRPMRGGTPD